MDEGREVIAPRPRAEQRASTNEAPRYTRDEVIRSYTSSVQLMQEAKDLTASEKAALKSALSFEDQTLDRGKQPQVDQHFEFKSKDLTKKFHDKEGPRVDVIKKFLDRKIAQAVGKGQEAHRKNLEDLLRTLEDNSRPFYDYDRKPKRREAQQMVGRIQYEASLIANDERNLGTPRKNYFRAVEELSGAEELVFPPKVKPRRAEERTGEEGQEQEEETQGTTTPQPEPQPEPEPEPPPPPERPLEGTVVIGRTDELIRKTALEEAEKQLRAEMRRGTLLNPLNWMRKIALRVGSDYFRQKMARRAETMMRANHNAFGEYDLIKNIVKNADFRRPEFEEAQKATVKTGETLVKSGEKFEGQVAKEVTGPLKQKIEDELIKKIIRGEITQDQLQKELTDFVKRNISDSDVKQIFGVEGSDFGKQADYFASNIYEVAMAQKENIDAGKYAIDEIDRYLTIDIANVRESAETANYTRVDHALKWLSSHKLTAGLANPAVVGAVGSLTSFFTVRALGGTTSAARFAVPVVGTLSGAGFAAWRRNYELKVDFASHSIETAYSEKAESPAPRREALDRILTRLGRVSAADLISGGGEDAGTPRLSAADILSLDFSEGQNTNIDTALRRYAEIKTRLDFSAINHVDLITFSSKAGVKGERLELIKAAVAIKQALREKGVTNFDKFVGEYNGKFTQNKEQQDRAFRNYRIRESVKAAGFGAVAGFGSGLLVSEMIQGGENIAHYGPQGIFGVTQGAGETFRHDMEGNPFKGLYEHNGSTDIGDHFRATANPDHTLRIFDTRTGEPLPDSTHFSIDTDGHIKATGEIPQDLRTELESKGFKIAAGPDIVDATGNQTVDKNLFGTEGEWTKHATGIDHREWYAYDQPGSQGNELEGFNSYGPNSATFDMSHMEQGFQHGLNPNPIDVQDVIKNGQAGIYVSMGDSQNGGLWIPDSADGVIDGKVNLTLGDMHTFDTPGGKMTIDEAYKMIVNQSAVGAGGTATELNNHTDIWALNHGGQGGFIEYGRMTNVDGKNVLQTFATIHGNGTAHETISTTIPGVIKSTTHTFDITPPDGGTPGPGGGVPGEQPGDNGFGLRWPPRGFDDLPPIIPIPFSPRHPLEPTKEAEYQAPTQISERPGPQEALRANLEHGPEELRKVGQMLAENKFPVPTNHDYFIQRPPEKIALTDAQKKELEIVEPFFVELPNGLIGPNPKVAPFVWDPVIGVMVPGKENPRFKEMERLNSGDSGLLALASVSAQTPGQQEKLYRTFADSIVNIHQSDPELLSKWLAKQSEKGSQNHSSLEYFRTYDHVTSNNTIGALRPVDERLILFDTNNPEQVNAELFNRIWAERLIELKAVIDQNNIQPKHLRWIEFLSHSVDVQKLTQFARAQQPAPQPIRVQTPARTAGRPATERLRAELAGKISEGEIQKIVDKLRAKYPSGVKGAGRLKKEVNLTSEELTQLKGLFQTAFQTLEGNQKLRDLVKLHLHLKRTDKAYGVQSFFDMGVEEDRKVTEPTVVQTKAGPVIHVPSETYEIWKAYQDVQEGKFIVESYNEPKKVTGRLAPAFAIYIDQALRVVRTAGFTHDEIPIGTFKAKNKVHAKVVGREQQPIRTEGLTVEQLIEEVVPRTPEEIAKLEGSRKGWKIHLNVSEDKSDAVTARLISFLKEQKFKYKIGKSSDQEGKGATIWVGSRDDLEQFAKKLEEAVPGLPEAKGDPLNDDVPVGDSKSIWARFDTRIEKFPLKNVPKEAETIRVNGRSYSLPLEMHQYGSHGIPFFKDDMMRIFDKRMSAEEARPISHEVLKKRFGTFYTGSENQFDPYPATATATEERSEEIQGVELQGDTKAGIDLNDINVYKSYLDKIGANYEIYRYKNNPRLGLLVILDGEKMQDQIFNDLVHGKNNISGGFWSNNKVSDSEVLDKVAASKSMSEEEVGGGKISPGDKVRLTRSKISQLRKDGLMYGFPQIEGSVKGIGGDSLVAEFGYATRQVKVDDVVKIPAAPKAPEKGPVPAQRAAEWTTSALSRLVSASQQGKDQLQATLERRALVITRGAPTPRQAQQMVRTMLQGAGMKIGDYEITEKGEIIIKKMDNVKRELEKKLEAAKRHAAKIRRQQPASRIHARITVANPATQDEIDRELENAEVPPGEPGFFDQGMKIGFIKGPRELRPGPSESEIIVPTAPQISKRVDDMTDEEVNAELIKITGGQIHEGWSAAQKRNRLKQGLGEAFEVFVPKPFEKEKKEIKKLEIEGEKLGIPFEELRDAVFKWTRLPADELEIIAKNMDWKGTLTVLRFDLALEALQTLVEKREKEIKEKAQQLPAQKAENKPKERKPGPLSRKFSEIRMGREKSAKERERQKLQFEMTKIKGKFDELRVGGKAQLSRLFATGLSERPDMLWQRVVFNNQVEGLDDNDLFRGYLMVEPKDMPEALKTLMKVAEERRKNKKDTDFKWLITKPSEEKTADMHKPGFVGNYDGLKPADPRIVIYGDSMSEVIEVLEALAKERTWGQFERNRKKALGPVPPRRPGTNSLPKGKKDEWRTLNYNDKPGLSEKEASDPDWRDFKLGQVTKLYPKKN